MLTEIDEMMSEKFPAQGPGAAVAVVQGGNLTHCKGYGLANLEWNIAIQPDTVFRLASVTKQFTATAILLLEQQGKLHVSDPITTYLPDYPTHGRTISIEHLLTHTSGIKSMTSLEGFLQNYSMRDMSHEEMLGLFKDLPLEFEPGEQYLYNNSGYYLLGLIIEAVSGLSYEQFIQQHIFQPLNMQHSYYMSNEAIIARRASGYGQTEQGYRNASYLSMLVPYSAGALGSTVEDLVLWDAALREHKLLDSEALARMYTPTKLTTGQMARYGYGWGVADYHGKRLVAHDGGINGFSTNISRFPDDATTIILLSNLESADAGAQALRIARSILGISEPVRNPVVLSQEALDSVAGEYKLLAGFTLKVAREDDKLILHGPVKEELIPLSETTFYSAQDEDVEVHFSEKQEQGYSKMAVHTVFDTMSATRV